MGWNLALLSCANASIFACLPASAKQKALDVIPARLLEVFKR